MPYIKQKDREVIDPSLQTFITDLKTKNMLGPGRMNYIISTLLTEFYPVARGYSGINEAMGVLSCVSSEYYRRLAVPYEQDKIAENGDIF